MRRLVLGLLVVASSLLSARLAHGEDPPATDGRQRITVTVGHTAQAEVGFAMGHFCDDETIIRAEMRNKDAETNVFVVTGLKSGTTLCRAGTVTVEDRPTYLFEITVTAEPKPRTPGR